MIGKSGVKNEYVCEVKYRKYSSIIDFRVYIYINDCCKKKKSLRPVATQWTISRKV